MIPQSYAVPLSLSISIPAQYFATTMVIVGLSVIATVLVLQYHHHDPDGAKMPKWVSLCPSFHSRVLHSLGAPDTLGIPNADIPLR